MRILLGLMAVLALGMPSPGLFAQQTGSITGTVVDQNTRQPLAGVSVTLSGTQNRVVTDNNGRYRLPNVPPGSQTISASLIGYAAQSRPVTVGAGQTATVDLVLSASAVQLEGIVVNAVTGTVERKREIGNAVGTVNAADFTPAAISRPAEVLQGRVAGVTLQSTNGTTGTGQKIRIRGANSLSLSNEPLIIVDGIRYDNSTTHFSASFSESGGAQSPNRLNDLSPDDIASIEVLKGPAASGVYGTAAANGVIVITTKQGVADRTQSSFYAERGLVQERTNYPDNIVALGRTVATGAAGACQLRRVASGVCVQDSIARFNVLRDERTTPFRDGDRQKFGGTLSGGGSRATYYLSGDLEDEEGVFANNDLRRATLRANVRAPVTDNLTLTATTAYVNSSFSQPSTDNSVVGGTLNALLGSALFDPEDPDAVYYAFAPEATDQFTLVQDINRFTGGLTTNWRPLSWLTANSTAGIDFINNFDHQFLGPNIVPLGGSYDVGFVEENRGNTFNYTLNGALNATFPLSDRINATSTLGVDYNRQLFQVTRAFGQGVTPGTESLLGTSTGYRVGEDNTEVITIGGIAQQQIGINDRIFLTGAIRVDDNSAFGEDFGLISYPSLSGSWVIGEEPFFPQNDVLSSLRLRAAYGKSGLRPNFRDAVTFFRPVSVSVNNSDVPGIALTTQLFTEGTGNVDLKPERTTEIEAGFDAGFFQDRVSLEFTAFNKRSEDALISRTLPPSLGLSLSRFENLGEVRNSGVELALDALLLEREQFEWSARIAGATLRNRIVELGEDIEPIILNRGMQKHEEGRPAGAFYQPKITFQDANGNGLIDYTAEEISVGASEYIGPVLPTFTGQFSTQLTLGKIIRLSTLFDMRRGHYQFNYTERFRCAFSGFGDRGCAGSYDPGSSLTAQAAYLGGILGDPVTRTVSNALWVEKADFVKWRELSVTISPPSNWTRFLPGSGEGFSLTLAGRNLKTWTDYSGTDPESNETGSASNFTQGEFGTQPPVRYLTARLNFAF